MPRIVVGVRPYMQPPHTARGQRRPERHLLGAGFIF